MPARTSDDLANSGALLARASCGDARAWGKLLTGHEERLKRMVVCRLDPRLRGRVDAADVIQEAYLEAADHRERYFRQDAAAVSVFLWLRGIVGNKLLELHRYHLGTHMRDVARETTRPPRAPPGATSAALVEQLTGHGAGPGTLAARVEAHVRLRNVLDAMESTDREVLVLRHFEQLTNGEAAAALGIEERAAAKRYLRALARLKSALTGMPGGLTELRP
jgi:RNA polymerase sigma-70 factor (ECF subfamily)